MKKRIAIILFCAALLAVSMFALTGCGSILDKYKKVISDFRDVAFSGSSVGYSVEIISGWREENFSLDGVSGNKVDYTVFTVTPKNDTAGVEINVTIGNKEYKLPCDKHPLGTTFSAEIAVQLNLELTDTLELAVNGESITASTRVPSLTITGTNALEISSTVLTLDDAAEIYVRLIENPVTSDGEYYWYVATYTGDSIKAALIDVATGEILAIRK